MSILVSRFFTQCLKRERFDGATIGAPWSATNARKTASSDRVSNVSTAKTDLCADCYENLKEDEEHGDHLFIKFDRKFEDGVVLPPRKSSAYLDQPAICEMYNNPVRAHKEVTCDGCDKEEFFGPRYRCVQCSSFDLCQLCYHGAEHDASHAFIQIVWPHGRHNLLYPRSATSEEDALRTFILISIEKFNEKIREKHRCCCDGCGESIVGTRYQSVQNLDIDLCAECYHSNKHSLSDEFYAHDDSYSRAGETSTMKYPPRDKGAAAARAAEVSQPAVHQFEECSICRVCPIIGMRYRCGLCDISLCTSCYNDEMHSASGHPMWEMARPNEPGILLPPRSITDKCLRPTYFGERHGEFYPSQCTECRCKGILGPYYSCTSRSSDLCKRCYGSGAGYIDREYELQREPEDEAVELKSRAESGGSVAWRLAAQVGALDVSEANACQEWKRHDGCKCDVCTSEGIVGTLYSCLTCKWDLCADCFERREHAVGHAFARIDRPFAGEVFAGLREGCDGHLANHVSTVREDIDRSFGLFQHQMTETMMRCYKASMIPYIRPH